VEVEIGTSCAKIDDMTEKKPSSWNDSTTLARAILHDRAERRKWMARMMVVPLAMLAIGLWGINEWLEQNPWRFVLWWAACGVATCVVMIFALYDALAVVREERERQRSNVDPR
jgi:hypothetical protein